MSSNSKPDNNNNNNNNTFFLLEKRFDNATATKPLPKVSPSKREWVMMPPIPDRFYSFCFVVAALLLAMLRFYGQRFFLCFVFFSASTFFASIKFVATHRLYNCMTMWPKSPACVLCRTKKTTETTITHSQIGWQILFRFSMFSRCCFCCWFLFCASTVAQTRKSS